MIVPGTLMIETVDGHSPSPIRMTGTYAPAEYHTVLKDPVIASLLKAVGISPHAMEKLFDDVGPPLTRLAICFDPGEGPDLLNLPSTHSTLHPADAEHNAWWNEVADCTETAALVHLDHGVFLNAHQSEGAMHYTLTVPGLPASVANEDRMPLSKIIEIEALSGMNLTATRKSPFPDSSSDRTDFHIELDT